jgi:glycosyltransferase involved in cell wall biosynthesis
LKILLVNTHTVGGAARACIRLHEGLLLCKAESKLLVKFQTKQTIPETYNYILIDQSKSLLHRYKKILYKIYLKRKISNYEKKYVSNRPKELEEFSFPYSDCDIKKNPLYQDADIINLHWVSEFLNYLTFFKNNKKPVVWTLHDMNPFSGGEHFNERYCSMDSNGKPVTRIINEKEEKIFNKIITIKKEALKEFKRLCIVCPSKWLQNEAMNSEVFGKYQIKYIPNGIDPEIYHPRDRYYSRELLGLPQNKNVLLFVSQSLDNFRKGYRFLLKALEKNSDKDIVLCAISSKKYTGQNPERVAQYGHIKEERLLSAVYSAADAFVIPSLEDNLPNTMIESLMCGTPVIGFPTGGIVDAVKDGINGFICPEISVEALSNAIEKLFMNKNIFDPMKISKEASLIYDLKIQAKAYIELYKSML